VASAVVWTVAAVVIARTFAVGGWVRPWLALGALVCIPATVLAWVLAGPLPNRTSLTAALLVVSALSLPVAIAGATPSVGRLTEIADGLEFPGRVAHEVTIGSGRCRPSCSEIRRTIIARGSSLSKFQALAIGALRARHYVVREYPYGPGQPIRVDAKHDKVLVSLEIRSVDLDTTRIAVTFIADGPAPAHSVG
jgi:hypothetical protein